jgi:hypothetical protein
MEMGLRIGIQYCAPSFCSSIVHRIMGFLRIPSFPNAISPEITFAPQPVLFSGSRLRWQRCSSMASEARIHFVDGERIVTKAPPWHLAVTLDLFLSSIASGTFIVSGLSTAVEC